MHVLPLPFGLALALGPRREADKLRTRKPVRVPYEKTVHVREQLLLDYFVPGRQVH
ncbi:MAG TPA: hypothetical protein VFU26_11085 [Gaiellaceae bacterium]|nr:hypothetical protein [Gaiellaceae bacterium]